MVSSPPSRWGAARRGSGAMAHQAGRTPGSQFRPPVSVSPGPASGLRSAGTDLLSAAKNRCSWYPAPAKAGAASVPHCLHHRWAGDLGLEARASRRLWEGAGSGGAHGAGPGSPRQQNGNHGNCGAGAGGSSPSAPEQHSSQGCCVLVLVLGGLLGPPPAPQLCSPGVSSSCCDSWWRK